MPNVCWRAGEWSTFFSSHRLLDLHPEKFVLRATGAFVLQGSAFVTWAPSSCHPKHLQLGSIFSNCPARRGQSAACVSDGKKSKSLRCPRKFILLGLINKQEQWAPFLLLVLRPLVFIFPVGIAKIWDAARQERDSLKRTRSTEDSSLSWFETVTSKCVDVPSENELFHTI